MEILAAAVGSIAENISNCLFDAAGRQIGYLLNYNDNIKKLREQAQNLKATRDSIQVKIQDAERNRGIILPEVRIWISKVDNVSAEAENFLEDEVNANKRCFKGWCIDLRSRYRFSKAAKQKIAVITPLQEKHFQDVSQPAPPQSIISSTVGVSGNFKSRESIKNEIMDALKDDKVSIIGISGMGGVGKTTLVKEIRELAKEEKLYDSVVMVVVSQTPSIANIQREIAYWLELKSLSDHPESAKASLLWERIKSEKRILIILDDVWAWIKLEEIGIPFGKDHGGCKIVLTSRRKDVCDQMDCDKTFIVGTLSKQESWALFKELVGMDVENSIISPIAREVAAECDGLPIAIVTVARALKNKDKYVWIDAARQLKRSTSTNIEGMRENVISSLELSFNYLESEAKSLFLFCSLFPEDFSIDIERLVNYGTGLRWFKDLETTEDIRARTHAIVSGLISSFLLIQHEYYQDCVKMHDVVRDVAHIIAPKHNQKFLVKAGIGLEEWPKIDTFENLTCISLMSNNIKELPDGMECPKLQSLLLQKNSELVFAKNCFQGMKGLKVLDLSSTQLLQLPESLSLLANLRTLYVNYCMLGDLTIIGNLCNLEILSLHGSDFTEIPKSFSKLIYLWVLDLIGCRKLKRIANGVISSLSKLEELCISSSFTLWDFDGDEGEWTSNAKLAELQYLSRLTTLKINIPNVDLLLDNDVPFKNLSSFTIIIGAPNYFELDYVLESPTTNYSRKIMISNDDRISRLPEFLKNLVIKKTEHLSVFGVENIFHDLVNKGFNELKGLPVENQGVTYLLNQLKWTSNLGKLDITNLPNVVEIFHGEPPTQSFNKLKSLYVDSCNRLSNIVPSNWLQKFQNLESLEVFRCESVVYIFDCKQLKVANGETKFLLSLKDLDLYSLPEMTHIWKGDTQYIDLYNLKRLRLSECPNLIKLFSPAILQSLVCLEKMQISYCDNLEEMFEMREEEDEEKGTEPRRNDLTTTSPSLGNLTSIEIKKCSKLKNLFTPSIVKRLVKLKTLDIVRCSTLEGIITNEDASIEQRIVFPSLSTLSLGWLDNIACFSSSSYYIEFPVLERVDIYGCPNMKTFGYGEQLTQKLNKVYFGIEEERWMGNLNSTVEQRYIEEGARRL